MSNQTARPGGAKCRELPNQGDPGCITREGSDRGARIEGENATTDEKE